MNNNKDSRLRKNDISIGILAFQGDIEEHEDALKSLGYSSLRIKSKADLENITHLIIPGGESTVISKFLHWTGLDEEIKTRAQNKTLQIYGTCAGAILLATEVESNYPIHNLGLIEAKLSRNAYGSQINSFEAELEFKPTNQILKAIFIRAPKIISHSNKTKVLCQYNTEVMMLEQENILISTFHPELIRPAIIHEYFLNKE